MNDKRELNTRWPRWEGENWDLFKLRMEAIFEENDVDDIARGIPLSTDATEAERTKAKQKQARLKCIILDNIAESITHHIIGQKTGGDMWQTLVDFYEGTFNKNNMNVCMNYQERLLSLKCRPNGDIIKHLNELFQIRARLTALNQPVSDQQMVTIMLRSLPDTRYYDEFRRIVRRTSKQDELTPEALRAEILSEELDRQGKLPGDAKPNTVINLTTASTQSKNTPNTPRDLSINLKIEINKIERMVIKH